MFAAEHSACCVRQVYMKCSESGAQLLASEMKLLSVPMPQGYGTACSGTGCRRWRCRRLRNVPHSPDAGGDGALPAWSAAARFRQVAAQAPSSSSIDAARSDTINLQDTCEPANMPVPRNTGRLQESDSQSAAVRELIKRRGQAALTREEQRRRQRSLDAIGVPSFQAVLAVGGLVAI